MRADRVCTLLRSLLFLAIVLLIRQKHAAYRAEQTLARAGAVPISGCSSSFRDASADSGGICNATPKS